MQFDIITIFPEMFTAIDYGIVGRAKDNGLIDLRFWNPRDYTRDNYHRIDDTPYGGGSGMVMMVEPLQSAIAAARRADNNDAQVVYLAPQGKLLNHNIIMDLRTKKRLILVSGRYKGIDERLMEIEPGTELSIGDYVLSGGELAAMVLIDAVTRQIPEVVSNADSIAKDSFSTGMLDYPHYTRPESIAGQRVPEVLLSGNHKEIERFRKKQSLGRTWLKRPELLEKIELTAEDRMLLNEFLAEQGNYGAGGC